jgi:hypothetical protein
LCHSPLLAFIARPGEGFAFDLSIVGDVVEADTDPLADAAFPAW